MTSRDRYRSPLYNAKLLKRTNLSRAVTTYLTKRNE